MRGGDVEGDTADLFFNVDPNACNVDHILASLAADPIRASAWTGVLDVAAPDMPAYLARLTPLALSSDTAVTEYGFFDGRAIPYDAVLQRGTVVLVSEYGVPTVSA